MHVVSIYHSGVNDHPVSTRRLTKQFPTSIPDVTAENRKTIFRRPDHVILAVPDRVVYAAKCRRPKPPKGVGFTDPLSGTLNLLQSWLGTFYHSPPGASGKSGLNPSSWARGARLETGDNLCSRDSSHSV